jgi:hypothetical protein
MVIDVIHSLYDMQSVDAQHRHSDLGAQGLSLTETGALAQKSVTAMYYRTADEQEPGPLVAPSLLLADPGHVNAAHCEPSNCTRFATSLSDNEEAGTLSTAASTAVQAGEQNAGLLLDQQESMLQSTNCLSDVLAQDATTSDPTSGVTDSQEAVGGADQVQQLQAASSAYLAEVDQLLEARGRAQADLTEYIERLTTEVDEDGHKMVELPADYAVQVSPHLGAGCCTLQSTSFALPDQCHP